MDRIVVAVEAGEDEPWLADAAAELARETGAAAEVVSVDGIEMEALATVPRFGSPTSPAGAPRRPPSASAPPG